jgi:hypothetical protein
MLNLETPKGLKGNGLEGRGDKYKVEGNERRKRALMLSLNVVEN